MIQPTAPDPLEVYKNMIIITHKTKKTKIPLKPSMKTGMRRASPNMAVNNCNGIEDHKMKKQLTSFVYDKSRNTPFLNVK